MTDALHGRRVLVTRAHTQADALNSKLIAVGAIPVVFPTIEIVPLEDPGLLDHAIQALAAYQWVIFTSVNGVASFWERLTADGRDGGSLQGIAVAAIGPETTRALIQRGVFPRYVPREYVAEAIAAGIGDVSGQHILLPTAEIAREALAVELRKKGAVVDEVAAYRTNLAKPDPRAMDEYRRGVDAILFTSSSTVRNFVLLAGSETRRAVIACIGPITAQTASEMGLPVHAVAAVYTLDGLVQALTNYFTARYI
ncbi:MAG: uroporphyrinogen-III synthase [Lysobacterales bacterium]